MQITLIAAGGTRHVLDAGPGQSLMRAATKAGIEGMLKRMVPEVREVVAEMG